MDKPQVSVVVPVYNVARLLRRCIDSILTQTFQSWECLLIDDGSEDGSGLICDDYAHKDWRFISVHQKNQGASVARNNGIEMAKGQFVAFIDADDYLSPSYLENLLNAGCGVDMMVIQRYGSEENNDSPFPEKKTYNGVDGIKKFVEDGYLAYSVPHSKLFSLNTIKRHRILFPVSVKIGEDLIFIVRYLQHTDKIIVSDKSGYVYVNNPQSIQHKRHSIETERNDYQQMRSELMSLCRELSLPSFHEAIWRVLGLRLRKYVKTACLLDFKSALSELRSIENEDFKNYGSGISGSWQSRMFKFFMNHRLFVFIIGMVRIEITTHSGK